MQETKKKLFSLVIIEFTEACWHKYKAGEEYIPGLAERSAVRKLWMNHTREAIAKLGTEEALSTPTTAPEE